MSCDDAREFVVKALRDQGVYEYVDQGQIEDLVTQCCDDFGSEKCVGAIGAVAATAVCIAYTEGACVPCCSAAGGVAGKIVGKAWGTARSIIGKAWGFVSGLFGSGGCDFSQAANALIVAYAQAYRVAEAAQKDAYVKAREAAGLRPDPGAAEGAWASQDGPGFMYVPVELGSSSGARVAWPAIMRWNATRQAMLAPVNARVWTVKGKNGYLYLPPVNTDEAFPATPENFYAFQWVNWQCDQPNNWSMAASDVLALRHGAVERASQYWVNNLAVTLSREVAQRENLASATAMGSRLVAPLSFAPMREAYVQTKSEGEPIVAGPIGDTEPGAGYARAMDRLGSAAIVGATAVAGVGLLGYLGWSWLGKKGASPAASSTRETDEDRRRRLQMQVAFTTDRHGRPLAYRWAPMAMRWFRIGYDQAHMLISTGRAREVRYTPSKPRA